ncbi:hypothetical protein HK097_003662 [Rhizophlyctis rosea]|uniref:Uncharacterized protein n=1 Tax=Rhizophlyctis rosea TaxID=64517 RepID=A0AAD5WX40_9FUNG|nr:hypothetical protein HK097_003662 [Rhizophlyctis rosea]
MCAEISEELRKYAWWLMECKVWTQNIRQTRIRNLVLREMTDRRRRALVSAVGGEGVNQVEE